MTIRSNWKIESVYTISCNGITAVAYYKRAEGWEVYYTKPRYPLLFAFGIPDKISVDEILYLALANVDSYAFLFDEQEAAQ